MRADRTEAGVIGLKGRVRCALPLFLAVITGMSSVQGIASESIQAICGNEVRYVPEKAVSMDYLGRLASPITVSGGPGTIVFWPFDEEGRPVEGGWVAQGVVLANSGDIGSSSSGGVLWSKKGVTLSAKEAKQGDGPATMVFELGGGKACRQGLNLTLRDNGSMYLGNALIGAMPH